MGKMQSFGKKGNILILIILCAYALSACVTFPGLSNTVIPALAEKNGIDMAQMITYFGYVSWLSIPAMFFWARLGEKKGARVPIIIGLFGGALSFVCLAFVTDIVTWCVAAFVGSVLTTSLTYAGPALIASWFPTKKGLALGWATMGIILVDLLWTPNIATPIAAIGYTTTFWICAVIVIIIAVIACIFIKNTPEEAGVLPDNMDQKDTSDIAKKFAHMRANYVSDWTIGRVVKNPKVWAIAIATGLFWMAASSPVISFYGRMGAFGYDIGFIGTVFTVAAIFALIGSWLFGFIDQKTNPKTALIIYGVASLCANLVIRFLAPTSAAWTYIGTTVAFACVGGIPNLQASLIASIWGRWDFSSCAKIIQPIAMSFVMCNSIVMGICLSKMGDYELYLGIMTALIIIATIIVFFIKTDFIGNTDDQVETAVYGVKSDV